LDLTALAPPPPFVPNLLLQALPSLSPI
jgi:hypothetical protein